MKKRFTNKKFSNIGDVLGKVLHQYRPMTDPALLRIWDLWEAAVGTEISANASPAAIKADMLLVHVSNSTWLHHLRFRENEIIEKLNNALGSDTVQNIRYKIGPI